MKIILYFIARRKARIRQQRFAKLARDILPAVKVLGLMYVARTEAERMQWYLDSQYDEIGNPVGVPYPW